MRRRDLISLLLATAVGTVRAQEPAKHHRIAIVVPADPVEHINDTGRGFYRAIFEELHRLG